MPQNQITFHATRIALAFVYIYFGVLKFFDGCSPAEVLAGETIHLISFKLLSASLSLQILAVFETALGLLLLSNRYYRAAYFLFLAHMLGTFTPFFLLPELAFNGSPLVPTLVGQYIWKNVVYVAGVSAAFAPVVFSSTDSDSLALDASSPIFVEHAALTGQSMASPTS